MSTCAGSWTRPTTFSTTAPASGSSATSPQERQIAQLAAQGLSNRQIGTQLFLSHRTVGSHLYHLFPKLGITTRSQLADFLVAAAGPDGGATRCVAQAAPGTA